MQALAVGVALCLLMLTGGAQAARLALVVGMDSYQSVTRLRNARADAETMAAALKAAGYDVQLQTDRNLRQFQADVRNFRQRVAPGDEVVFFFSGHGVQLGGTNYLLPTDVSAESEEQVKDDALALSKVLEDIRERKPRFTLAIIDACRDNPFAGTGRSLGGRGLTGVAGASGQMVIYAAGEGQKALDRLGNNDTVRNGLFTRVFVREMAKPGVSIRDVLYRVRDEVATLAEAVRHEQVPAVYDQVRGNFYFTPPGAAAPSAATLVLPPLVATTPVSTPPAPAPQPTTVAVAPLQASDALLVRIGHAGPTTGTLAHLGLDNERGAQLAVEELNARGLRMGGRALRFELVAVDDGADPRQATAVAERLVEAGVVAVVGHLNSGTSIPASAVYARAGIAQITPSATNVKFTRQGYATTFRLLADDARLGQVLGRYAVQTLRGSRVAVVDDRTAYGQAVAEEFAAGVRAAGGTVVSRQTTNDRATDFTALGLVVAESRPDVVFFGGMDAVGGPMLRQFALAGVNAKFMGGDGICSGDFPKLAAGAAAVAGRVVCAESGGVSGVYRDTLRNFQARFRKRFGADVQLYAPYTFDAVNLIADAVQRSASVSPAAVLRAVAGANLRGVTGPIGFDSKGDLVDPALTLYTYRGTQRELLTVLGPTQ